MCINVHALFLPGMDKLNNVLDQLDDGQFRKFQRQLQERDNFDGGDPIAKALLQGKDRMETTDLILQRYPEKEHAIMRNVLPKVGRKDLLKQY